MSTDWLASVLGGGVGGAVIGGVVALLVSNRVSQDKHDVLTLQREQFDEERRAERRTRLGDLYEETNKALDHALVQVVTGPKPKASRDSEYVPFFTETESEIQTCAAKWGLEQVREVSLNLSRLVNHLLDRRGFDKFERYSDEDIDHLQKQLIIVREVVSKHYIG